MLFKELLAIVLAVAAGLVFLWVLGDWNIVPEGLSFVAGFGIRHAISKVSW